MKSTYNFPNKLPALRNKQGTDLVHIPDKTEITDMVEKHRKDAVRILRIWLNEDKNLKKF